MAGFFSDLRRRFDGERKLFVSDRAPFRSPEFAVGQAIPWEGRLVRITRWVELPPITLERGGKVSSWEVWGRPLSPAEVHREMDQAAEALLAGATEAGAAGTAPAAAGAADAAPTSGDRDAASRSDSGEAEPPGDEDPSPGANV